MSTPPFALRFIGELAAASFVSGYRYFSLLRSTLETVLNMG